MGGEEGIMSRVEHHGPRFHELARELADGTGRPKEEIEAEMGDRVAAGARRIGYVVAALVNVLVLWLVHRFLDWGWPGFLTEEWDDVLSVLSVSIGASIVANLVFAWRSDHPIKPLGDLVTTVLGLIATIRVLRVFPFEFTGTDWSWAVRTILIVAIVGMSIAVVALLGRLFTGPPGAGHTRVSER
jgi:hypothetical protein